MFEFKLPDLGEGIHEGEILKWYVAVGDHIDEDAPLCDVETDKAAVTIPSPRAGTVRSLTGGSGDSVDVGQVIAVIDDGAAEDAGAGANAAPGPKLASVSERPHAAVLELPRGEPAARLAPADPATRRLARELGVDRSQVQASGPAGRVTPEDVQRQAKAVARQAGAKVAAAPATRRLARELGVELGQVPGSGPGGRVTPDDVTGFAQRAAPPAELASSPVALAATPAPEQAPRPRPEAEFAAHAASAIPFLDIEPLPDFAQWGPVEKEPLRSIRRKVAHRMVTSMILVPHVAHMDEADVTELEVFRQREKEKRAGEPGGHLTLLPFVVKAVTAGLRAAPSFNASLEPFDEEIIYKKFYNVGVAVDTGKGLMVPVVKGTDRKSIMQLSSDIEDLATRARAGKIAVDELRGGTFTITNVGPIGGTALIPTINYPEVAILGMGRVQEKPVVRDGQIVVRKMLPLTLAFDHRIADGADAARFVTELVRQLSDPNLLLLET